VAVKSFLLFAQRIIAEAFSKSLKKVIPHHQKDQVLGNLLSTGLFRALVIVRLTVSWDTPYSLASWRKLSFLCRSVRSGQSGLGSFPLGLTTRMVGVYTGKRPISMY